MLWCNFGFAEVSVRGYNKLMASENKHDHNLADLIIDHIYAGLQTANAQLKQKKKKPIYCTPDKLKINVQNLRTFIKDEVKFLKDKGAKVDDIPVSIIIATHLEKIFPC